MLSHCGEAGTLILILLCYGNWHKVYREVRYVMSCGSPLLSSMCKCEWRKTKNQRIQAKAKDVLVLCILLAGHFFVLSGRLFCLQHIHLSTPTSHPLLPPPSKQSVCLGKDRAVSIVQSQGQKFFHYSTCNWCSALKQIHKAKSERTKEKIYPPNFHFSQPRFPKLCHCSHGVYEQSRFCYCGLSQYGFNYYKRDLAYTY